MSLDWKKYLLAFFITAAIFGTAVYLNYLFNQRRVAELRQIEERIAIDTLSLETQFDLLGELNCKEISENSVLSGELNTLASRLAFTEESLGTDDPQVVSLKKQYTLLQIKDYLLMQEVSQKCGLKPVFMLYFYSNAEGECENCRRAGDVLTYLRNEYPGLRVYSFDYNLDLGALRTLIAINDVKREFPAFLIKGRPAIYGFRSVDDMLTLIPELKTLATSTLPAQAGATTTQ